jgi:hypothetical protein
MTSPMRCRCGQPKPKLAAWCYHCRTHIEKLADMKRSLILTRIKETELNWAWLQAALEVGNAPNIS